MDRRIFPRSACYVDQHQPFWDEQGKSSYRAFGVVQDVDLTNPAPMDEVGRNRVLLDKLKDTKTNADFSTREALERS